MVEGLHAVEHVDNHGDDGDDALVGGSSGPGGPAAFGSAGYDVFVDGHLAAFGSGAKGGDGVHGANGSFGHGDVQWPSLVAGFHVLHPAVGDDLIFGAFFFLVGENERLVG